MYPFPRIRHGYWHMLRLCKFLQSKNDRLLRSTEKSIVTWRSDVMKNNIQSTGILERKRTWILRFCQNLSKNSNMTKHNMWAAAFIYLEDVGSTPTPFYSSGFGTFQHDRSIPFWSPLHLVLISFCRWNQLYIPQILPSVTSTFHQSI